MTKLASRVNLAFLAGLGAIATAFAMVSTSTCTFVWFYQPKMPSSLIMTDE